MTAQGYRLSASTAIHVGDRAYQQDQVLLISHPRVHGCVLGVVADGMGGRSGGRKASDQVIMTARQLFLDFMPRSDSATVLLERLAQEAHMVIKLTAIASEQEPHSTVAAFLLMPGGMCYWLHSGDSRIYHYHEKHLVRRTSDHSYVQTLVESGELTEDEARLHPKSNLLLGCLGMANHPPVATHQIQLQPGDSLLACTDGLWHYFNDHDFGVVLEGLSAREAAEFLVNKARSRASGQGDNLCLALVKLEPLAG